MEVEGVPSISSAPALVSASLQLPPVLPFRREPRQMSPSGAAARPTPLAVVAAAPGEQCDHGHPPQAGTSAERPCPWSQACRLSSLLHTRSLAGTTYKGTHEPRGGPTCVGAAQGPSRHSVAERREIISITLPGPSEQLQPSRPRGMMTEPLKSEKQR